MLNGDLKVNGDFPFINTILTCSLFSLETLDALQHLKLNHYFIRNTP